LSCSLAHWISLLLPPLPPLLPLLLPLQKEVLLKEVLLKKRCRVFSVCFTPLFRTFSILTNLQFLPKVFGSFSAFVRSACRARSADNSTFLYVTQIVRGRKL